MISPKVMGNNQVTAGVMSVQLFITFYTENGPFIITGRADNLSSAQTGITMSNGIYSLQTQNDNNDDVPTFSMVLAGGRSQYSAQNWEDNVKPNDYVKVEVAYSNSLSPVANDYQAGTRVTLIAGLVSDINIGGNYSSDQVIYTITCQGVAKILSNVQLSAFQEILQTLPFYALIPDDEQKGVAFNGNSSRHIIAEILDRFIFNNQELISYNYSDATGSQKSTTGTIFSPFIFDPTDPASEKAGNFDEAMYSMPSQFINYQGSLLAMINDLANKPFNELYWTHEEGVATLHHRFTPFDENRWKGLPIINIDNTTISSINVDNTDIEQSSVFKLTTTNSSAVSASSLTAFLYPLTNQDLIKKWGYKLMEVSNNYFNPIINNDDDSGNSGNSGSGIGEFSGNGNPERMFNYLVSAGWTKQGAAAALGNAQTESGFNPKANNGNHVGIVQWDTSVRFPRLKAWAKQAGLNPMDFDTQVKYISVEMQSGYPKTWAAVHSTKSPDAIARIYVANYEGAAGQGDNIRASRATDWYNKFKGNNPSTPSTDNTQNKKSSSSSRKEVKALEATKDKTLNFNPFSTNDTIGATQIIGKGATKFDTKKQEQDAAAKAKAKAKALASDKQAQQKLFGTNAGSASGLPSNITDTPVPPSYGYVNSILNAHLTNGKIPDVISQVGGGEGCYVAVGNLLNANPGGSVVPLATKIVEICKAQGNTYASLAGAENLVNAVANLTGTFNRQMFRAYLMSPTEYFRQGNLPTVTSPMTTLKEMKAHPYKSADELVYLTNDNLGYSQASTVIKDYLAGKFSSADYDRILSSVAFDTDTSSTAATTDGAYEMIIKYTRKLFNWYADNSKYYSGTVVIQGAVGIEIGKRLQFVDKTTNKIWDFYIESVSHTFDIENGWLTAIGVTRGLKLDSPDDNKRFSFMYNQYMEFVGGYFGEPTLVSAVNTAIEKGKEADSDDSDGGDNDNYASNDFSSVTDETVRSALNNAVSLAKRNEPYKSYTYSQPHHFADPWASTGPVYTDCSGLTYWVYQHAGYPWAKFGITPNNSSTQQQNKNMATYAVYNYTGQHKTLSDVPNAKPGDLFFYDFSGKDSHVGLFLGFVEGTNKTKGTFISADGVGGNGRTGGSGVQVHDFSYDGSGFRGHVRRLKKG